MATRSFDIDGMAAAAVSQAAVNLTGALSEALSAFANSRTSKQLLRFAEDFGTPPSSSAILEVHRELGQLMQASAIASYGQAKGKFRKAMYEPERPRRGKKGGRDSGGLARALHSSGLWEATPQGIEFGIVADLDRHARHWARLNFGAAPTGQGSHERFLVRFSNLAQLEFNFDVPARPGYALPKGFWKNGPERRPWGGGSNDAFYPKGQTPMYPTKGNIGYQFLDAGVARFFREMPSRYRRLIKATSYTGGRVVGITAQGVGEKHRFTARGSL